METIRRKKYVSINVLVTEIFAREIEAEHEMRKAMNDAAGIIGEAKVQKFVEELRKADQRKEG
jgi:hypothetical protein